MSHGLRSGNDYDAAMSKLCDDIEELNFTLYDYMLRSYFLGMYAYSLDLAKLLTGNDSGLPYYKEARCYTILSTDKEDDPANNEQHAQRAIDLMDGYEFWLEMHEAHRCLLAARRRADRKRAETSCRVEEGLIEEF